MATKQRKSIEDVNQEAADAARAPQGGSPIQVTYNRWSCVANGCPVFAANVHGADQMACMFHADLDVRRWSQVTQVLRRLHPLIEHAQRAASHAFVGAHPRWAAEAIVIIDSLDLEPELYPTLLSLDHGTKRHSEERVIAHREERDYPKLWAYRMLAFVRREVFSDAPLATSERELSPQEHAISLGDALANAGEPW